MMNSDASPRSPGGFYVVGIAGSLRRGSFNRALLAAAQELAPATLRITARDLSAIPLYNADLEDNGVPGPVLQLRDAVREADAVLFVTPEHNHGMSGVLKNTLDWLSRPPRTSALYGKPAAIMGATPGMVGTARAQDQLRQAFVFTNTFAMIQPEVLVSRAHEKFDKTGRLTDESTRSFLAKFLERFETWIAKFRN